MTTRFLRLLKFQRKYSHKTIYTSSKLSYFWEPPKPKESIKTDGKEEIVYPDDPLLHLKKRLTVVFDEFKILGQEIKKKFTTDPILYLEHDQVDVLWQFNGDPTAVNQWVVTMDSDHNIGRSAAKLELSSEGAGIFYGNIDTRPVQDGRIKYAGFCNIRTIKPRKSFHRKVPYDWGIYTHLILRVRGDGRNYNINLHPFCTFDIMWNDLYSYILHTRGGPYWQYVKIPFSKFLLSSKGRVQDGQCSIGLTSIIYLSITAAVVDGPFKLEIDFIGLERDLRFEEKFAYEMYKPPNPFYI